MTESLYPKHASIPLAELIVYPPNRSIFDFLTTLRPDYALPNRDQRVAAHARLAGEFLDFDGFRTIPR